MVQESEELKDRYPTNPEIIVITSFYNS